MNRGLFAAALMVGVVAVGSAQTPDTATIRGTVADASHALVTGAEVRVTNRQTGLDRTVTSDKLGRFALGGLPVAGEYELTAKKPGFAETHRGHLMLAGGTTAEVALELTVGGGTAVVTVVGAAGEVRADQPQLGIELGLTEIEQTPLPNRRITFLPLLNAANRPAINQGDIFMDQNLFTTNGAGRRQAWFEVDGGTGNDSWGRQTMLTNLPESAVQEMTVLTNAFSTEYGASTGSVVNIVTKSGGQAFHGEALGLFRPNKLGASLANFTTLNAASGNDITNDRLTQISGAVGGPLTRGGRTRFFLAAEHSDEDKGSPVTSALAVQSYTGVYHDWLGFGRIDHQINANNSAFLKANADAYFDTNPNGIVGGLSLPTVARIFHRRTYTTEFGETAVIRPSLLNSARVQFQLASPITEFDPVVYGTQFVVPIATSAANCPVGTVCAGGTFTSGTSQNALLLNHQYEANDVMSATRGRHQINFGGGVVRSHTGGNSKEFGGPIFLGKFTYNSCTQTAAVCESAPYLNNLANVANYQQSFGGGTYTVDDTMWDLFVQDDWKATQSLTINAGLRYERQTFTDATLNFAPRAGFVYDVAGQGKIVVRGGFGIYHSQIVDNSQANYSLTGPTGVFTYTASAGQPGFPTSVAAAPLPAFPAGGVVPLRTLYLRPGRAAYYNQFFATSALVGYPGKLLNPYSEQWTVSFAQEFAKNWSFTLDYVGTHQLRNIRPLDVDAPTAFVRTAQGQTRTAQAANCTRPLWVAFYAGLGTACDPAKNAGATPAYSLIQSDVNDGYLHYNALDLNVHHTFSNRFEMLASYTWSHTQDNVDPDATGQNPNDANFTGHQEYGNAIFDQRHRLVVSGVYEAPLKIRLGGIVTAASGLPYNLTTGATNSGDTGGTTDRPVINGAVVTRNTGRGGQIYDVDPFVSRAFPLYRDRVKMDLRAEAFNVLNHVNSVGFNGVYGNGAPPATLGAPLAGVTAQLPARSLQFSGKLTF